MRPSGQQYRLTIVNPEGGEEAHYEYNAVYISDVTVEAGQVHLERLQKSVSGYERIADDTLMQNQTEMPNTDNILTARINETQKRVYSLKTTSDNAKKTLNVSVPQPGTLYGRYHAEAILFQRGSTSLLRIWSRTSGRCL